MIKGTLAELHEARQRVTSWKLASIQLLSIDAVIKDLTDAGFDILQKEEIALHKTYPSARDFLLSIPIITGVPAESFLDRKQ